MAVLETCIYCGGAIEFRTRPDGVHYPVHVSGGVCQGYERVRVQRQFPSDRDECRRTKCPKCGAGVFFIRHNDGSVWIDELGPPWPKHGCFGGADELPAKYAEELIQRHHIGREAETLVLFCVECKHDFGIGSRGASTIIKAKTEDGLLASFKILGIHSLEPGRVLDWLPDNSGSTTGSIGLSVAKHVTASLLAITGSPMPRVKVQAQRAPSNRKRSLTSPQPMPKVIEWACCINCCCQLNGRHIARHLRRCPKHKKAEKA